MSISKDEIVIRVQDYIGDKHPGGATLTVVSDGIRHEEDWWYIPVKPDFQPAKRFEYYEALAETEVALQQNENLTVLLIPVWTDETVTA